MEQVSTAATTRSKRSSVTRLTKSSKILKVITKAIKDKKGENIIQLDLRRLPEAVTDFLIVCEGGSHVQVKAIANHIEQQVKEAIGELPYKHEGQQTGQWVLIDYVNVVVHVMHPEARKFYRLEELWSDGVAEEM